MQSNKLKIALLGAFLILDDEHQEKTRRFRRKQRTCWVRPLFLQQGFFETLRGQLRRNDPELFHNFLRMSAEDFDFLAEQINPLVRKQTTNMREAISVEECLAITLRFLATGDNYSSLMFLFKRSKSSICNIVSEVCEAIYQTLKDQYLKMPSTEEEWKQISNIFNERWNFPNCVGAIDGKHVGIIALANCGSEYFNYKKKNSIVLMALTDGQYNFIYIDVGAKRRESDGGVFGRCSLSSALQLNMLNLPGPTPLPARQDPIPFVITADDAFPLKSYIMKPYNYRGQNTHEGIFSYRLSRARRVVENVFGIAAARFRILRKPIETTPDKAKQIVLAICSLHNFLMKRKSVYATPSTCDQIDPEGNIIDGSWRMEISETDQLRSLEPLQNEGRGSDNANRIREEFKNYFMNEGEVPWQYKCLYKQNEM